MTNQNDDFLKKLLATFRVEAGEHLQAMSAGLIELEKNPAQARRTEIVETVFRESHSLKGAARAVNLKHIESVCQSLESVFAALKDKRLTVSAPLFDLLQEAIAEMVVLISGDGTAGAPAIAIMVQRLDQALQDGHAQPEMAHSPQAVPPAETQVDAAAIHTSTTDLTAETVRVSTQKLDAVMRQVEELLVPRLAATQRTGELRELAASFVIWKKRRSLIRPALRAIERGVQKRGVNFRVAAGSSGSSVQELAERELPQLLEYMEAEQTFMKMLEQRLLRLSKFAAHDGRTLAGMADSLLHDVKEMHLLPFSSLLEIIPRLTRELARDQGKQVELEIRGGEIEIDRRILEEMKAPLIHLLRNCLDHGIEVPAVRQARGKPQQGTITIAIEQKDGGKIELRVADDGGGIDAAKVKAAACRVNLISAEDAENLDEEEAQALVFRSGVSTSQLITDMSGRGLGLAIVREKVERLGGGIVLESGHGKGTSFLITLPLMMATLRGVLVRVGEQIFAVPALSVERAARVEPQDIRTVENRATILLDKQAVSLVSLGDVLELPRQGAAAETSGKIQVIVLGAGSQRVAFRVDEILGEQEILVKALGRQLARVRNVAGASVLGTGRVVVVLNVPDLLKSAAGSSMNLAAQPPAVSAPPDTAEKQAILVVEDSITSRSLLKNILESAGYLVTTAVDGMDGYTTLKTGKFDLVVSDVEMPRMDGFDLTAKVRADKQFGELPVVLVTALESREHRERGIDVGANAYIVKSSFDQSNLLEVVRRLI